MFEKMNDSQSVFEIAKDALIKEREVLFTYDVSYWGLSEDEKGGILNFSNKEEVLELLLPEKAREVDYLRRVFGHYLLSLKEEKVRVSKFYGRKFENHFRTMAQRNIDLLTDTTMMVHLLSL